MLLELRDLRQTDNHDCCPAAARVAFSAFGYRYSHAALIDALHTSGMDGTDPRTLEAMLRKSGWHVLSGDMSVEDLKYQTRLGRPVIVLVTLDCGGHYVTVRGVHRNRVHFHDTRPANGGFVSLPTGEFEAVWHDFDRFGTDYRNFGLAIWP